ncbi:MAG: biotin biosynthesis protein BioC [candidate division BRC1 bacterium ADurb.BinA364]|nr:MAG: biotin biosynthesis protein BioC [candidate division BRC1 bacterium ADurb.BinA364]
MRESLAPGGRIVFAALIEGTLAELAECYRAAAGRSMPALALWSAARCQRALEGAGFAFERFECETLRIGYADAWDVMRSIKRIGATLGGRGPTPALSPRQIEALAMEYTNRFRAAEGGVSASYRVAFGAAFPRA